jgi:hypothetical protein
MQQRIHSRRPLQILPTVEGGIEAGGRRTARPPAQKRIVEQGSPRDAPALRLVIELAEVEIPVETSFENGQARRHDMKHGRPKHAAERAPEHHAFDEEGGKSRDNRFDRDIGRESNPSGPPWVRLVS